MPRSTTASQRRRVSLHDVRAAKRKLESVIYYLDRQGFAFYDVPEPKSLNAMEHHREHGKYPGKRELTLEEWDRLNRLLNDATEYINAVKGIAYREQHRLLQLQQGIEQQ